jgi:peptide/nickel transport system ATP-binding protein
MADRIVVLRYGRQVEENSTTEIISNPQHEYTRELMGAVRTIPPIGSINIEKQCVPEEKKPLLSLVDICASYKRKSLFSDVREKDFILKDVSFEVHSGEVVALVGESGSGKSTIARVIAGLLPPISGGVLYRGLHLDGCYKSRSLRQLRRFQFVVQSPDTSLNPERSVLDIIGRPLELYGTLADAQKRTRVEELLEMVELPADYADRFPMELSGGERQRINLARAIAADPDLLLCDEVLSALDTIVAASVLELMKKLRKKLNMAYLFISHDLATVAEIADRVIVLYAGRVCENGPADKVFAPPYHPYTALLLQSVPQLKTGWLEDVISDRVDHVNAVRDVRQAPLACAFRNRCPYYDTVVCDRPDRRPHKLGDDHFIFCHRGIDELMSGTNPGA